jgi:hypothetical protein
MWHKAKIVDIIREEPVSFKVHFNGWKPKHDEWLEAGSPRLAALGQFTEVVMVDVVKPPLIPWYENTAIHALVSYCHCYCLSLSYLVETLALWVRIYNTMHHMRGLMQVFICLFVCLLPTDCE